MSDHNFCTPPEILDLVRQLDAQGKIGLDPCSNLDSMVDAKTEWSGLPNGLSQSWRGYGLVFMNPPHSMSPHNIEPWIEKAYNEFFEWTMTTNPASNLTDQFIGLIPAKTDTAWFHDFATEFPIKCFLRGRPKFWLNGAPMPGPGKFASMLIYAGHKPELFTKIFSSVGWIV